MVAEAEPVVREEALLEGEAEQIVEEVEVGVDVVAAQRVLSLCRAVDVEEEIEVVRVALEVAGHQELHHAALAVDDREKTVDL